MYCWYPWYYGNGNVGIVVIIGIMVKLVMCVLHWYGGYYGNGNVGIVGIIGVTIMLVLCVL